jgi:uncharacterized protein (TIGR04168 family)
MRIAVVGDVHLIWDERDVRALDAAGYDLVLFVGDLAGYGPAGAEQVGRSIAALKTPALVMPGNHDAVTLAQLAAEVLRVPNALRQLLSLGMARRVERLRRALGPVPLCGYSVHAFESLGLSILAARPHTIGGPRISFARYLSQQFSVRTLAESAERLCALIDQVPAHHELLVLAHCGPRGLGAARNDIYGCDFRPEEGDWGDPDLAQALQHASRTGKRVVAVVAGHMHHRLRGGGERRWQLQGDSVLHVNAARVPRARRGAAGDERHHVGLTLGEGAVRAEPVWLAV